MYQDLEDLIECREGNPKLTGLNRSSTVAIRRAILMSNICNQLKRRAPMVPRVGGLPGASDGAVVGLHNDSQT